MSKVRVLLGLAVAVIAALGPQFSVAASATDAVPVVDGHMAGYQASFPPTSGQFSVETKVARVMSCPKKGTYKVPLTVAIGGKVDISHLDVTVLTYECHNGVGSSSGLAGDLLRVVLEFNPPSWPDHIVAKIENLTTGQPVLKMSRQQSVRARSLFLGLENQFGTIPPFQTVDFFNANLNGAALGALPGLQQDVMVDASGNTMISTSNLTANGKGFSLTYSQGT